MEEMHPAMKIKSLRLRKMMGMAAALGMRTWFETLDYRVAYYDPRLDPVYPGVRPHIYLQWHEYIPFFLVRRAHGRFTLLVSQHGDGEVLSEAVARLGFNTVRGSSKKGGAAALREMMRLSATEHFVVTPDGPRGPRRVLSSGPIYLASKLQMPILCLGLGYDRPWRLDSWDRFAIPRPYSRARGILGPSVSVPPDLDRDGIEEYRVRVEETMNRLTLEAEAWAEAGTGKAEQYPLPCRRVAHKLLRRHPPHELAGPHALSAEVRRAAAS